MEGSEKMIITKNINGLINNHIMKYALYPNRIIIDILSLNELKKELGIKEYTTLTGYNGCKIFIVPEENTIEVYRKEVKK